MAVVKPQSAFFERFGSAGVAVLERTLAGLRDAGTLSLLDVKRGDIGIDDGRLRRRPTCSDGSPLPADAITVSPYLGYESLRPALDLAAHDRARASSCWPCTSNPEGAVGAARRRATARPSRHRSSAGVAARQRGARGVRSARQRRHGRRRDGRQRGHRPRARPRRRRRPAARARARRPGRRARRPCARPSAPRCRQVLGTSSREVLGAGPDAGALREPRAAAAARARAPLVG